MTSSTDGALDLSEELYCTRWNVCCVQKFPLFLAPIRANKIRRRHLEVHQHDFVSVPYNPTLRPGCHPVSQYSHQEQRASELRPLQDRNPKRQLIIRVVIISIKSNYFISHFYLSISLLKLQNQMYLS